MADNILRLTVEDSEYNAKLKKAAEGIRHLAEVAHRGGGELTGLEKAELDYVKALGSMETKSRTASGSVRELESTFKELTVVYNHLNDVEKQDEGGKALRASLDQIKQRAQEARAELDEASKSLQGAESSMKGVSDGNSGLTSMLAVFGGNLLTKGVSMLTSELVGSVQQSIELAQQGEGIRNAFERLNKPGLLDNLKEATHGTVSELDLMKQAVKFDNFKLPLDQMGTLLAFAQQQAKDTGQSVDYMVDSIVTGLGRKSLPILDNLGLSASEIRERMKESGDMTTAVADIIRDRMEAAGGYVETSADRAARATAKAQDAAEAFGRNAIPIAQEWAETWATLSQGAMSFANTLLGPVAKSIRSIQNILNSGPDVDDYKNTLIEKAIAKAEQEKRKSANVGYQGMGDKQKVKAPGGYVEVTDSHTGAVIGGRHFNNLEDKNSIKDWQKGLNKSTRTSGSRSNTKKEQTELQQNQKRINDLTQKYVDLMSEASRESKPLTNEQRDRAASIKKEIRDLERRNGQLKLYQEQAKGKFLGSGAFKQQLEVDVAVNNKKIEEMERQLINLDGITIDPKTVKVTAETDEARQKVEELKRQIADLKDQNIMINAGMASLDLQNARDLSRTGGVTGFVGTGKSMMPIEGLPPMSDVVRQRGGNLLDDKAMKAVNDGIYGDTGKKGEKNSAKSLLNGISQLTDGLQKIGIDIPEEVQAVIGVIQGVMQVIEAVNTIIGVTQTSALAANTAAMISLEAALWANTSTSWLPFANGGVVHAAGGIVAGNTYSGDQIPAMLNAGEVVLNRAQAGNLASQLENGASQNMQLEATVTGEQIRFVLNNNSRRRGKGEYVTSKKRNI